jgi:PAS domain S-box-containing protein
MTSTDSSMPRAVVVSDDADQVHRISELLQEAGLQAFPFSGATTALTAMDRDSLPALIVTDLEMTGIDGWRFCRLLRSPEYALFNPVPILLLSSTPSIDEPAWITSELGANAFLSTPLDRERLVSQVRALLGGKRTHRMRKILIVEASVPVATSYLKVFRAHDQQTQVAHTLPEALTFLDESDWDLAVVSYDLPDGGGEALLEALPARSPHCAIVLTTASLQPELTLTLMQMGAAAVLGSPVEPEYLYAQCEQARRERSYLRGQAVLADSTRRLMESEQKYRSLIQYASDPIFSFNPDETYRFVNEAFARPFGKTPEEIIGKTPHAIFPFDEAEKRLTLVRKVFKTAEKGEIEVKVITTSGDQRYYLTLVDPIKDDHGQVLYVTCISKDITERRKAEETLRGNEEYLRAILQTTKDGFWMIDGAGKILRSNQAYSNMSGYSLDELHQMRISEVEAMESPDELTAHILSNMRRGGDLFESRHRRKDGTLFDVEISAAHWDQDGGRLICFCRDITERKRVEKELYSSLLLANEAEQKYRMLFREMLDAFALHEIILDEQGRPVDYRFISVNPAFERMVGLKESEIKGRTILEVLPATERYWIETYGRVALTGEPAFFTSYSQETQKYFEVSAFQPAQNQFASIFADVTDRHLSELALKAAYAKLEALWSVTSLEGADPETISDHILKTLARMTGSDYGFLGVIDPETSTLTVRARSEVMGSDWDTLDNLHHFDLGEANIWTQVVQSGATVIQNDYHEEPSGGENRPLGHPDVRKLVIVPHFSHGKVTSLAAVANRSSDYGQDDVAQISTLLTSIEAIVESKRAEQVLKHSHDLMRYIIEHVGSAVSVLDKELRYIYVSQRYLQDFNLKEADVIGTHHYEVFPEIPERWREVHQKALAGVISSEDEDPFVREDGSVEWSRWECRPWHEADGSIGGIILYTEKITERKRAEEALRASEEKYRLIVENQQDLLVKTDATGRYLYANPAYCALFEKTEEELLGSAFAPLVHSDDLPGVGKAVELLLRPPYEYAFEERALTRNGWRWLSWVARSVLDERGRVSALISSGRDVTERRQAQEKIKEQIEELRRWHDVTLGREDRILDLKREVNGLLRAAGQAPRYASAEAME